MTRNNGDDYRDYLVSDNVARVRLWSPGTDLIKTHRSSTEWWQLDRKFSTTSYELVSSGLCQ